MGISGRTDLKADFLLGKLELEAGAGGGSPMVAEMVDGTGGWLVVAKGSGWHIPSLFTFMMTDTWMEVCFSSGLGVRGGVERTCTEKKATHELVELGSRIEGRV